MDFQLAFQAAIFFTQVILLFAILAYLGAEVARGVSAHLDVPFLGTRFDMLPNIEKVLQIRPGDVVYDLGCGDGRLLFYCAARHRDARFIGIERNPVLYAYSRFLFFKHGSPENVELRRGDIFKSDFSDATRVFVFLLPRVMGRIFESTPSFSHDLRLVSRAFQMPDESPTETARISAKDGWFGEHLAYVYEFSAGKVRK